MDQIDLGVCSGYLFPAASDRTVVMLPGARYLPSAPLLWFARLVAVDRGWSVLAVWDEYDGASDPDQWTQARFEAAVVAAPGSDLVVLAKSLTSRATRLAAERVMPGIWLTPLMTVPEVVAGLTESGARNLAIGGSADPTWDRSAAHRAGIEVFEVPGADHSLGTADPHRSLEMLRAVTDRIGRFLDAIG